VSAYAWRGLVLPPVSRLLLVFEDLPVAVGHVVHDLAPAATEGRELGHLTSPTMTSAVRRGRTAEWPAAAHGDRSEMIFMRWGRRSRREAGRGLRSTRPGRHSSPPRSAAEYRGGR
jgi:hypothetical protein